MRLAVLISFIGVTLLSCNKLDKEEKIPSYIGIYGAKLITDQATQGDPTHNIFDVWINIDGNRQGTYEIPATFPVLATGKHKVTIRAGIKNNGIASFRIMYPFYDIINIDTTLPEGKILTILPEFRYKPETIFSWIEAFENNGFTLDRMIESDTALYTFADTSGSHFGRFYIDAIRKKFSYKSTEAYYLPKNGSAVFLELDYRCNHPFTVGLLINKLQNSIREPILVINPHTNKFNHIYVDLTPVIVNNTDAINFNILIEAVLQDGYYQGCIDIDNLKLLHF